MAGLLIPPQQFFDSDGDVLAGGKIYTYEAGTSNNKATYPTFDDAVAGTNANANPVVLDSEGRAQIWLTNGGYKIVKKTSGDVAVGNDWDDVYAFGSGNITVVSDSDDTIDINILADNQAKALTFLESTNEYLNFNTTNNSEAVEVCNTTQNQIFKLNTIRFGMGSYDDGWGTTYNQAQFGSQAAIMSTKVAGTSGTMDILYNAYNDGSNYKVIVANEQSTKLTIYNDGVLIGTQATAGAADSTITYTNYYHLDRDGNTVIGDESGGNGILFKSNGDQSFTGTSGFYPRLLSQSAEPAAGTGATQLDTSEMCFWIDTDDSKLYLCFNQAGTVKTVELT